jgi:hypothetical protein
MKFGVLFTPRTRTSKIPIGAKDTAIARHALHYFHYNFVRVHQTIKTTPAVAANVANKVWTMVDFVELLEREERLLGGRLTDDKLAASKTRDV